MKKIYKCQIMTFLLIIFLSIPNFSNLIAIETTNNNCYNYSDIEAIPDIVLPQKENWKKWVTKFFIVTQGAPYHMAHDLVIKEGMNAVMVGKFDYGAVFHKDLEYEDVHAYIFGGNLQKWLYLGRYRTNSDGKIYVNLPEMEVGEYVVKMIVAGDLSETNGYLTVVKEGQKAVIFDIDGTLTLNDFEAVGDYLNLSIAREYPFSVETVNLYNSRGYLVIFLTARPYWTAKDTREWYYNKNFSIYTVTHFTMENKTWAAPTEYKTEYMHYLGNEVGLELIAAYGNSESDFDAYYEAGIPTSNIYSIGENAGYNGSIPLYDDYEYHYYNLIDELACNN